MRARPAGTSQRYEPGSLPSRPGPQRLLTIGRISRDGRGQRSSRGATGIPGRERTERRFSTRRRSGRRWTPGLPNVQICDRLIAPVIAGGVALGAVARMSSDMLPGGRQSSRSPGARVVATGAGCAAGRAAPDSRQARRSGGGPSAPARQGSHGGADSFPGVELARTRRRSRRSRVGEHEGVLGGGGQVHRLAVFLGRGRQGSPERVPGLAEPLLSAAARFPISVRNCISQSSL